MDMDIIRVNTNKNNKTKNNFISKYRHTVIPKYSDSFISETFSSSFRPKPFWPKPFKTVDASSSVMNGLGLNGDGNVSNMKKSLYLN